MIQDDISTSCHRSASEKETLINDKEGSSALGIIIYNVSRPGRCEITNLQTRKCFFNVGAHFVIVRYYTVVDQAFRSGPRRS